MSFQLQGGNAASNDYDYESGSGMDAFLSRSIDEVSWQSNLSSSYVSLSNLPIGTAATTDVNYDQSQVSGTLGSNLQVNQTTLGQSGSVDTIDANGNTVFQAGVLN